LKNCSGFFPARSGIRAHHQARRETSVRLRRSHRAEITVITRKAYGGAYCVMASKHIRTTRICVAHRGESPVMGPEGAVNIGLQTGFDKAPEAEREKIRQPKIADSGETLCESFVAASAGYIYAYEPLKTRTRIIQRLAVNRKQKRYKSAQETRKYPL